MTGFLDCWTSSSRATNDASRHSACARVERSTLPEVSPHSLDRREFKYLVPDPVARDIAQAISSVCSLDPNAGPDGTYLIRSLYLDNEQLGLYWANEREEMNRYKARIRTYPPHSNHVWLEVKARSGDSMYKTRACVPMSDWEALVKNPTEDRLSSLPIQDRKMLERFAYYVHIHRLQPHVLVEYNREAYFSHVDDYARVTFDRDIRSQDQMKWSTEAAPHLWRNVDHPVQTHTKDPMCVVELKFGAMVPRWMNVLIQNFELIRYSFSKYCYSIDAQKILPRSHVAGVQPRFQ